MQTHRLALLTAAIALASATVFASLASADDSRSRSSRTNPRNFDARIVNPSQPHGFTDAFYLANGINPVGLIARPALGQPGTALDAAAPDANHTALRLLDVSATRDGSGHPMFFTVHGIVFPNTFTNNAAGVHARQIAEQYKLYDFPRAANAQWSTFPKRQEAIADTSGGYFSNNPLGLWKIMHVRYVPAAMATAEGQRRLADMAARNGTDADGTPLLKTLSDIHDFQQRGLVTVQGVPTDGSAGPAWFMCPIIQDPRKGAIAPDATLTRTLGANGQPNTGELDFTTTFDALRLTGDFPR
jgi:hypothetical protein